MSQPRLRIYYGPSDDAAPKSEPVHETPRGVTVPLSEVFPILADAIDTERTWLRDFEDEEITISPDLYDVILSYQHFRRPSA